LKCGKISSIKTGSYTCRNEKLCANEAVTCVEEEKEPTKKEEEKKEKPKKEVKS
jgi:hypothetical protein